MVGDAMRKDGRKRQICINVENLGGAATEILVAGNVGMTDVPFRLRTRTFWSFYLLFGFHTLCPIIKDPNFFVDIV